MMRRAAIWTLLALAAVAVAAAAPLAEKYERWLDEVEPLITKPERKAFRALDKDYQRDAFIERFWAARDPVPETQQNEFKGRYYARREEALELFDSMADDRARVYSLNGPPTARKETDCGVFTWPLEIWQYSYSERVGSRVDVVFYKRFGGGPFRLWNPAEGYSALVPSVHGNQTPDDQRRDFQQQMLAHCAEVWDDVEAMLYLFRRIELEHGIPSLTAAAPPLPEDAEWPGSFRAYSTDVEEGAAPLDAELKLAFPGVHQSRTRIEATLSVPVEAATPAGAGDTQSYNFEVTGEVLRDEELFESFRYRFDVPGGRLQSGVIALDFERALRAGDYVWVVKLVDLNGGGVFRREQAVTVPSLGVEAAPEPGAAEVAATAGPADGEVSIALGAPTDEVLSGPVRFTAAVSGDGVAKVQFLLDGTPLLSKTRPPYSVEFDLGSVPGTHAVRAIALGADGGELATDELLVNPGRQAFLVNLVEPRAGARAEGSVRVRAEVDAPEGQTLDRVEFFVGDERAATLYQAPFTQRLELPGSDLSYVRVVGYLESGGEAEDWVIVNAGDFSETVDVRLVELYAAVLDSKGAPVQALDADDFAVSENGQAQRIIRFDLLRDLPLYVGLMVDTSASMAENLDSVHRIGQAFLEESLTPRDLAAVITFSEKPRLAAAFTSELPVLASALAGLRAESGTALWDSLVYAIDYFRGVKGQRALILLSDGEDRRSQHTAQDALQFAQRAGVTVYAVGLSSGVRRTGRVQLTRLAEQTGGRSFFLDSIDELTQAYAQIQNDLRTRYLLTYQSSLDGPGFRAIDVEVPGRRVEVRTLRGYFP
jgi:VWFA-related protein